MHDTVSYNNVYYYSKLHVCKKQEYTIDLIDFGSNRMPPI